MIYEEGRLMALTPEQRAYALAKAAEARRVRGELLAELRSGTTSFAEALARADEQEIVRKTRVSQLLRALPGFGPAKVAALMATCGVAENRRVGGLGEQQCHRLLQAVAL
ncbi:integration host factor, actinobacterial type [Nonomuraea insulae]|uniref:Integration host factor, actinobacterial type n=1 Tax=Nonomuraea insulae TaxID=1616787 RepID=A0ABW1D1Y6_9ACTN